MKTGGVLARLWHHRVEYAIEAMLLGLFMLSAAAFTVLLFHPDSAVSARVPSPLVRRGLMGLAMGATAIVLIYSPWGKRSGAHFNPAVTLAFWRLGRVHPVDAAAYGVSHFVGAVAGTMLAAALFGARLAAPGVDWIATVPGPEGVTAAFAAEGVISFGLMAVVLRAIAAGPRAERLAGLFAGLLVAAYILVEAPISGMSMNPARTFGPALSAHLWTALWVYFLAPPAGMLLAAEMHRHATRRVSCAKLRHPANVRCIFCAYHHTPPPA